MYQVRRKSISILLTLAMLMSIFQIGRILVFADDHKDSNKESGITAAGEYSNVKLGAADDLTTLYLDSGDIVFDGHTVTVNGESVAANSDGYLITQNDANTPTQHTVTVKSGMQSITLKDVTIDVSNIANTCAFEIQGDSKVNLTLTGKNTFKSGENKAGLQVQDKNDQSASVTINGPGSLTATGGDYGAGIGGGNNGAGGLIQICSGTVIAVGGKNGAGIGGGFKENKDGTLSASIEITAGAIVKAASDGKMPAIDAMDYTISPYNDDPSATVLMANFVALQAVGTRVDIKNASPDFDAFWSPAIAYQSIAMTVPGTDTYQVFQDNTPQPKGESHDKNFIIEDNDLVIFDNVGYCHATFDMLGHGTQTPCQNILSGDKINKPDNPSDAHCKFDGWYKDRACTTLWQFDTDIIHDNTTLFAKWLNAIEIPYRQPYDKTFSEIYKQFYGKDFTVSLPLQFKLVDKTNLPAGLTLDANSGRISGTPTADAGSYTFGVSALNQTDNAIMTTEFMLTIVPSDPAIPTGLTAETDSKLSDVKLPDGWSWKDGTIILKYDSSKPTQQYCASFHSADKNYNSLEKNLDVTVSNKTLSGGSGGSKSDPHKAETSLEGGNTTPESPLLEIDKPTPESPKTEEDMPTPEHQDVDLSKLIKSVPANSYSPHTDNNHQGGVTKEPENSSSTKKSGGNQSGLSKGKNNDISDSTARSLAIALVVGTASLSGLGFSIFKIFKRKIKI